MPDEQALLPVEERPRRQREPSQAEVATMIADQLGEQEESARQQILRIVQALGRTQSRQFLTHAFQAQEHGGMMTLDGSRRRTVGGIFFHLTKTFGKPKPGKRLRQPASGKPKGERQPARAHPHQKAVPKAKQPSPQPAIPFTWDDRIPAIELAATEKGPIRTVKITLIGRPGKIVDRGTCIVTVMEESKTPALPKGLPTPTSTPTTYAVYIASKQWAKVKDAIADPEDVLIVEGFPKTDAQVSAIAVFATSVTTKKVQQAQRQAQQAK